MLPTTATNNNAQQAPKVVILEVQNGDEKLRDAAGYRKDTVPILASLVAKGADASVVFYSDEASEQLLEHFVQTQVVCVVSRINPGNIESGEKIYFNFLQKLVNAGVIVLSDPKTMLSFGAKDAISKLAGTSIVPANTYVYYDIQDLKQNFPTALTTGTRVLKQNRGSQGSGIWLVQVDPSYTGPIACQETPVICTEMVDNHTEHRQLGEFMDFCQQYVVGENGMIVDMPFMPRIAEGEIRIFLVGKNPVFIVHKKPKEGEMSACLGSGAVYQYQKPSEWPSLMRTFEECLPMVKEKLDVTNTPLIWTADFILDTDKENGMDKYVLGEFNCSCVGFTSQLDYGIQEMVADEIISRINLAKEEALMAALAAALVQENYSSDAIAELTATECSATAGMVNAMTAH